MNLPLLVMYNCRLNSIYLSSFCNRHKYRHRPSPREQLVQPIQNIRQVVGKVGKGKVNTTSKEQSHSSLKLMYWRL